MGKSLDEMIEKRRKEALDKKVGDKAAFIVYKFGKGDDWNSKYRDDSFLIEKDCLVDDEEGSRRTINIIYQDREVFKERKGSSVGHTIYSFAPGDWEQELDKLYLKAETVEEKRKQKEHEELLKNEKLREQAKKDRWGL